MGRSYLEEIKAKGWAVVDHSVLGTGATYGLW